MKPISTVVVLLVALLLPSMSFAQPKARILREGKGEIGLLKSWPEQFKVPAKHANQKYRVFRLPETLKPEVTSGVLNTWEQSNFTDLAGFTQGAELETFRFIVHGLEVKGFVKGLASMSFDSFVNTRLLPSVQHTGEDFVRYYPYFFHKKTVVSASVVSQNNTATFGNLGLVLSVPPAHLLSSSVVDMHTPTDKDFYFRLSLLLEDVSDIEDSYGFYDLRKKMESYPILPLKSLIPQKPIETGGKPSQKGGRSAQDPFNRKFAPAFGIDPELLDSRSWYNEVAISPVRKDSAVKISGISVRVAAEVDGLSFLRSTISGKSLLEIAEEFDLPIIQILDGQYYETDIGF